MKKTALNRRTFLKGMLAGAAVSIGLPPLEAFMNANGTAYASGDGFPKRFGLFYWGNGVHPELWIPSDTGPNWTLSQQLTPFATCRAYGCLDGGLKFERQTIRLIFRGQLDFCLVQPY